MVRTLKPMTDAPPLVLRSLHPDDAPSLAALANNKNVWDRVRDYFPFPYTVSDAREFIATAQESAPPLSLALEYEGQFCGVIGLMPQTDVNRKTAEIGYWLGEPYWKQGLATEAVRQMCEYGFGLGFARLQAAVFDFNQASMRVLEKNGFVKEGIFRRSVYKNGRFLDEHWYGKLP